MPEDSTTRYPPELRERAVRKVAEISDQYESEWAAMGEVARLLGMVLPRQSANGSVALRLTPASGQVSRVKSLLSSTARAPNCEELKLF